MDEVCDSSERPTGKVSLPLDRAIVLPLEGKGDRSAVDEVTCEPAPPSRSVFSLSKAPDSDLTVNLSPALRAARVKARCPPKACVRAFNGAEG